MAKKYSIYAARTQAEPVTKGDLLNEMNKQLGILSAQISMMMRPDGIGCDGVLSDDEQGWYIVAMEDRLDQLREINDRLWEVN